MDQQSPFMCASHTKEYIGAIFVGALIGACASYFYLKQAPAGAENTYQAGFDAARKLVEKSSVGPMLQATADMRAISGTVTAISGNRITIHTQSMDPFLDPSLLDRNIIVSGDTNIISLSQKDQKLMQAEMEEFMKRVQSGESMTQAVAAPEPFTRTKVSIPDITVGDIVNVTATENIKTIKEFTASEIQITPKLGNIVTPQIPLVTK
ncbi:MAG: hypothetical protein UU88_C0005G0003 [Parcubacteria group bacterium GW2011_GWC1_42_11]|nr:MAG: hypothetical protein UU88_C0005G0003 [Parcubacteria group bacterium GW2011_GWC1_42_11]